MSMLQLPFDANGSELDERIIQQLTAAAAAAAAMGRSHDMARREGHRGRSYAHGHPQFLVFSHDPNAFSMRSVPVTHIHTGGETEPGNIGVGPIQSKPGAARGAPQRQALNILCQSDEGNTVAASSRPIFSGSRSFTGQSSLNNQDSAGPSDSQSFSELLKSRLSAASMRCKDSISKSTHGWNQMPSTIMLLCQIFPLKSGWRLLLELRMFSRMMELLDMRDKASAARAPTSQGDQGHAAIDRGM